MFLNPVARGSRKLDYPATAYILSRALNTGEDLATLAIVGNLATYVEVSPWRAFVEQNLGELGYSLRDAYSVVRMIDTCYQVVDKNCLSIARQALI